ncbi:hypothetical protein AYI69_g9283, partial [Smittium culicis]
LPKFNPSKPISPNASAEDQNKIRSAYTRSLSDALKNSNNELYKIYVVDLATELNLSFNEPPIEIAPTVALLSEILGPYKKTSDLEYSSESEFYSGNCSLLVSTSQTESTNQSYPDTESPPISTEIITQEEYLGNNSDILANSASQNLDSEITPTQLSTVTEKESSSQTHVNFDTDSIISRIHQAILTGSSMSYSDDTATNTNLNTEYFNLSSD